MAPRNYKGASKDSIDSLYDAILTFARHVSRGDDTSRGYIVKRQFSEDGQKNNNIKIGIIVGLTVPLFLIGLIAFLYVYRGSIHCVKRKKKHHHHHHQHGRHLHKSSSGKSGKSGKSAEGVPPEPSA